MEKIKLVPSSCYSIALLLVEMFQDDVVTIVVLYEFILLLVICMHLRIVLMVLTASIFIQHNAQKREEEGPSYGIRSRSGIHHEGRNNI